MSGDSPQYNPYTPTSIPPAPVLGVYKAVPSQSQEWKDAPPAVKDARILAFVGAAVYGLFALLTLFASLRHVSLNTAIPFAVYACLCGINIWLIGAHRKGTQSAWASQRALSILGLFAFPIGTIIHIMLLGKWSRPETIAWFDAR